VYSDFVGGPRTSSGHVSPSAAQPHAPAPLVPPTKAQIVQCSVADLKRHDPGGTLDLNLELMNSVIDAMSKSSGHEVAKGPEVEIARSSHGRSCMSAASAVTSASLGVVDGGTAAPSSLHEPQPPSAGDLPLPQLGRVQFGSPTASPVTGQDDQQQHDETRIRKAQQLLANMLSPGPSAADRSARSSAKRRRRRQHSAPASADDNADSKVAQTTSKRSSSMTPQSVSGSEPPLRALNGMMPRFPTAQLQTPEQCAQKSRSRSAGRAAGQGVVAAVVGWSKAAVR